MDNALFHKKTIETSSHGVAMTYCVAERDAVESGI